MVVYRHKDKETKERRNKMTTMIIPVSVLEDEDIKVCVFCDAYAGDFFCNQCNEYKGLMTIKEWEAYTGETWED